MLAGPQVRGAFYRSCLTQQKAPCTIFLLPSSPTTDKPLCFSSCQSRSPNEGSFIYIPTHTVPTGLWRDYHVKSARPPLNSRPNRQLPDSNLNTAAGTNDMPSTNLHLTASPSHEVSQDPHPKQWPKNEGSWPTVFVYSTKSSE